MNISLRTMLRTILCTIASIILMQGCIEDSITTSPTHRPAFSTDTLRLGYLFSGEPTATYTLKIYNPHSKILPISTIRMSDDTPAGMVRLNVDGQSGNQFTGVEIRPGDSIFVFVSVTPPPAGHYTPLELQADLCITTNGITDKIPIRATAQDVERCHATVITTDTRWDGDRPRQIFDSLIVEPQATLTLGPGTHLYFHDGAYMRVRGALITLGQPDLPVELSGDRMGQVITGASFDLMSRQWEGLIFNPEAKPSTLTHTEVRNTWWGVAVDSVTTPDPTTPALTLLNCRLRNSAQNTLYARHSHILALGSEFAESSDSPVHIHGGTITMDHCTLSNYYLFSVITGPCLRLTSTGAKEDPTQPDTPPTQGLITNTVIYGSSADLTPGDLTGTQIHLEQCLLRSPGTDDSNFMRILWQTDPLFYTQRAQYIFDYRPQPGSPVINAADPTLRHPMLPTTDWYGTPRPQQPSIGAYEPKP